MESTSIEFMKKSLYEKVDPRKLGESIMYMVENKNNKDLIRLFQAFNILDANPPLCEKLTCSKKDKPMILKPRPNMNEVINGGGGVLHVAHTKQYEELVYCLCLTFHYQKSLS